MYIYIYIYIVCNHKHIYREREREGDRERERERKRKRERERWSEPWGCEPGQLCASGYAMHVCYMLDSGPHRKMQLSSALKNGLVARWHRDGASTLIVPWICSAIPACFTLAGAPSRTRFNPNLLLLYPYH